MGDISVSSHEIDPITYLISYYRQVTE